METPNDLAGKLTERIMAQIREHLQPDELYQPHHYNRTYEAVYRVLSHELRAEK